MTFIGRRERNPGCRLVSRAARTFGPLFRAISSGLRHKRYDLHLHATLIRTFAFFVFVR
jgi:hypothetical protein